MKNFSLFLVAMFVMISATQTAAQVEVAIAKAEVYMTTKDTVTECFTEITETETAVVQMEGCWSVPESSDVVKEFGSCYKVTKYRIQLMRMWKMPNCMPAGTMIRYDALSKSYVLLTQEVYDNTLIATEQLDTWSEFDGFIVEEIYFEFSPDLGIKQ